MNTKEFQKMGVALRFSGRSVKTLLIVSVVGVASLMQMGMSPDAGATPSFPDVEALIDDSDLLLSDTADHAVRSDVLFTTSTGVLCRKTLIGMAVAPTVSCAGNIPQAPPGTVGVVVSGSRVVADGSARFLSTPPELFLSSEPPFQLPEGHKFVFWAYGSQDSVVCGVPPRDADLVCVLKASTDAGIMDPKVIHGLVIASSQSYVF